MSGGELKVEGAEQGQRQYDKEFVVHGSFIQGLTGLFLLPFYISANGNAN